MHALAATTQVAMSTTRSQNLPNPGMSALSFVETNRLASLRKSTPDSEAILSSDDEHDMVRSVHSSQGRTTRRQPTSIDGSASWLHEIQSGPPRRPSVTGSNSNASLPMTPLEPPSDATAWPFQNALGRVSSNPITTSWQSISPWSQTQNRSLLDDRSQRVANRDQNVHGQFQIQPTTKSSRSQSYSVGQQESGLGSGPSAFDSSLDRQRVTPSGQVPHRPSRPSMLSEVFQSGHAFDSQTRRHHTSSRQRHPSSSVGATVGQEQVNDSAHNPLTRPHKDSRTTVHGTSGSISDPQATNVFRPVFSPQEPPPSSGQLGGDESDMFTASGLSRRFSELGGLGGAHDQHRRSNWQSSLGFGALADIPQSRRHSMAEIPTRRNSLINDLSLGHTSEGYEDDISPSVLHHQAPSAEQDGYGQDQTDQQNRTWAAAYFSGVGPALRERMESTMPSISGQPQHGLYRGLPSQNVFSRPGHDTPLYLVSFKCARAEVYYVASNTGLDVQEGDLVIVEADRGHDLGTVLNARLDWAQAREMKAKATEEHYRWLMMFSRHNQSSDNVPAAGPGGMMAGHAPQHGANRPGPMPNISDGHAGKDFDLKPKMIKRLAQPNEIAILRDKEGNEAKAKRICQQKVSEMAIDMEILDAEFQTDWKKLTFFYYAHSYVNFNPLVTDLFKIYKTRIWMSAVNPASLSTQPIPPPKGLGPGAVMARESGRGQRATMQEYAHNGHGQYGADHYQVPHFTGHPNVQNPYAYGADDGQNNISRNDFGEAKYHGRPGGDRSYEPAYTGYSWNVLPPPSVAGLANAFANPWSASSLGPRAGGPPQRHRPPQNGFRGEIG